MVEQTQQILVDEKVDKPATAREQIRGSSLLLGGRGISLGINFATQVLMVGYLSQSDYGSWAYSFAILALLQPFATLGLKRSITRFIPMYDENGEYGKMYGTIILVVCTIGIVGLITIGSMFAAPELITHVISDKNYNVHLLLILIFLVPIQAIDNAIIGLFASFSKTKTIFVRRYLLAPLLRLSVVLLLIVLERGVVFLAYGYLGASLLSSTLIAVIHGTLMHKTPSSCPFNKINRQSPPPFYLTS